MTRRDIFLTTAAATAALAQTPAKAGATRYVRFQAGSKIAYGVLDGDTVRELPGSYLKYDKPKGATHPLSKVTLLAPVDPPKVLAVGLNYKSHIGNRKPPENPELFFKPTTCLQHPGGEIVIPKDSKNTHYEGELVIVIGSKLRNANREQAKAAIFGVTCGNDVSERDWQNGPNKDLQWWRAKGSDTFGPVGPWVVRGLDYGNLLLQTRLNGEVVQKQNTSDLLFDCPAMVEFASRYVTLEPGDIIFTGTPQTTKKMNRGDIVEVDIENIGVLRNKVV
jgi:2-keto-4-pentenoate hydratase/2-oxohepta-3-ene-1,7-dioic acid hydratase in catechol pathway